MIPPLTPAAPTSTPTPSAEATPTEAPQPVSPLAAPCPDGAPTTVSIMAHYDDDLLFANPQLITALRSGECVHTVFLTAGDAGKGMGYVEGRERGLRNAYDAMRGVSGVEWTTREVTLLTGMHATVIAPADDARLTITLLRLPDGNLNGSGFDATGRASLASMNAGTISEMTQVDTGAVVTRDQLLASVQEIIAAFQPHQLITLVPTEATMHVGDDPRRPDHSDHGAVGSLVRAAWIGMGYDANAVRYAVGYPGRDLEANVEGQDLRLKIDAFRIYSEDDPVSHCTTDESCLALKPFGTSLQRLYLYTDAELVFP